MQFFALFAAALATFATSAAAAPSPSPCNCPGPTKPETCPGTPPASGQNTTVPVRVGYTLDLHPETPLGSLSCSATFANNFSSESHFSPQRDGVLISDLVPPFSGFKTLGQLPTTPFYGEVPGAGTSRLTHPTSHILPCTMMLTRVPP